MEYVNYGPKTVFLIEEGLSSAGKSSIFQGNFILTEDVRVNKKEFFMDIEENNDEIRKFFEHDNKKFAVEISAAVALTDILSISDVFGHNPKNYGIVGDPDDPSEFSLQFVDHQPNEGNGLFSVFDEKQILNYSPRESLLRHDRSRESSPLSRLALESRCGDFVKSSIQEDVYQRLFHEQNDGMLLLESAILRAESDVMELVVSTNINFVENAADNYLKKYVKKIETNIEIYRKSIGK
jgi:hypothetical protein